MKTTIRIKNSIKLQNKECIIINKRRDKNQNLKKYIN